MNREKLLGGSKGFTLIEMAIVLIIIGIIIGAVVKGKDIIRSAEQKKIYSKFVNEWQIAYMNFYDRTGRILGDRNSPPDGQADASTCTQLINGNPPTYYGLKNVGLNSPTTNSSNACTYRYSDSEGNMHDISITFDYDGTDNYNYMHVTAIPLELAMALDKMIDGEADGTKGDFIRIASDGGTPLPWIRSSEGPTDESKAVRWKMQF